MNIFFASPLFCPPIQFFYALAHSNFWVVMDHLNYHTRSFQTQCKVKTRAGGSYHLLRVPILYPCSRKPLHQIKIDNYPPWKRYFLFNIEKNYENTEYYKLYIDDLTCHINGSSILLVTLNMGLILWITGLLKINPSYLHSQTLYVRYPKSEVIKVLCRRYGAEPFTAIPKIASNNREKNLSILHYLFTKGADETRKILNIDSKDF